MEVEVEIKEIKQSPGIKIKKNIEKRMCSGRTGRKNGFKKTWDNFMYNLMQVSVHSLLCVNYL